MYAKIQTFSPFLEWSDHESLFVQQMSIPGAKVEMEIIIIIIIYTLRVFHISFSWWSFTGV